MVMILIPTALLVVVALVAFYLLRPAPSPQAIAPTTPACPDAPGVIVGAFNVPAGPIEGYCQPQLIIAADIILAAERHSSDPKAASIGVMVGIGESGLRNLGYGDAAGPDSRGVFQQRSNYGAVARRLDPYLAASDFYQRMFGIADWQGMTPTQVAHRVQGNANPNYYTPFFPRAEVIVAELLASRIPPSFATAPSAPPAALRH